MVEIIDNRAGGNNPAVESEPDLVHIANAFGLSSTEIRIIAKELFDIYHETPDVESFLKTAIQYSRKQDLSGWREYSLFLLGRMSEMNEICWASHSKESLVHFIIMLRAIMGGA